MKTLKEYGQLIIAHRQEGEVLVKKKCKCGRTHLLRKQPGNLYIRCRCERLVKL